MGRASQFTFALYGATRDYAIAAKSGIVIFGPGPIPFLADALLGYAFAGALMQLVMRLVVGPATVDPLARMFDVRTAEARKG